MIIYQLVFCLQSAHMKTSFKLLFPHWLRHLYEVSVDPEINEYYCCHRILTNASIFFSDRNFAQKMPFWSEFHVFTHDMLVHTTHFFRRSCWDVLWTAIYEHIQNMYPNIHWICTIIGRRSQKNNVGKLKDLNEWHWSSPRTFAYIQKLLLARWSQCNISKKACFCHHSSACFAVMVDSNSCYFQLEWLNQIFYVLDKSAKRCYEKNNAESKAYKFEHACLYSWKIKKLKVKPHLYTYVCPPKRLEGIKEKTTGQEQNT